VTERAEPKRRLFLHAGTHKTGTTSVQGLMALNQRALHKTGILYPKAGRLATAVAGEMAGHHNIAWELNADARFDPRAGTLAQMIEEIRAQSPRAAVLSSEDFEYLYRRPDALATLAREIRSIGYSPVVMLYLRSQAAYAQSLYAELVRHHGLNVSFSAFLDEAASRASFEYRGWAFAFDYGALTRAFEEAFGIDGLSVRAYGGERDADALLRDFVSAFEANDGAFRKLKKPKQLNEAPTLLGVLESLYKTLPAQRQAGAEPGVIAREMFPERGSTAFLTGRFDLLAGEAAAAFQNRFREGNEFVAARYGVAVPAAAVAVRVPGDPAQRARAEFFAEMMRRWGLG
jgi:hypothetical protein